MRHSWTLLIHYHNNGLTNELRICICVQYIMELLEALVVRRTGPDETYRKLDAMASRLVEQLRLSCKQVSGGPIS